MDNVQKFAIVYRSSVHWEVVRLNSDASCYEHLADCQTKTDANYVLLALLKSLDHDRG